MAERVGPDNFRLAMTAGSEFCSPLLDTRVWDSKGKGYTRQQVLKSCACQQDRFLERNLGSGEKALQLFTGTSEFNCFLRHGGLSKPRVGRQNRDGTGQFLSLSMSRASICPATRSGHASPCGGFTNYARERESGDATSSSDRTHHKSTSRISLRLRSRRIGRGVLHQPFGARLPCWKQGCHPH